MRPSFSCSLFRGRRSAGFGWAVGGGLRYRGQAFALEVEGIDVLAQLTLPEVRVDRGLANSNTVVTGPDGYPIHVGFISGKVSHESWRTRPFETWRLRWTSYDSGRDEPAWEADVSMTDRIVAQVAWRRWLSPRIAVSLGAFVPYGALELGVRIDGWEAGVATQPTRLSATEITALRLVRTVAF